MKFLVLNFILLIGYFVFIANNDVINDSEEFVTKDQAAGKKLTYSEYSDKQVSVTEHVDQDIETLNNYRKDMLNKVEYIQKTFSNNEGVRKIAESLKLKPKKEKAIDPEFLEELKKRYSKKKTTK